MAKIDLKQVHFQDYSQSIESRVLSLEASSASSGSLWTGSANFISRQSDVEITGALRVSTDISASVISASTFYGDGSNLTGIVGGGGEGLWTASNGGITRLSDVEITGALDISSTVSIVSDIKLFGDGSGSFLYITSSNIALNGAITDDLVYQDGNGNLTFITEPTASNNILFHSASQYVWLENIDGGAY